jgi:hypothetical protein
MRVILGASAITLSLILCACSGQDRNQGSSHDQDRADESSSGPTSAEVDAYLEGQLPAHLDVEDLKTQNFINPNTSEGRVSASATISFNEAIYRDATDAEILDYLQQHGISQSERQLYVPFNQYRSVNLEHRFLSLITGPQTKYPFTTELQVKKTVEGWSLSGGRSLDGLAPELLSGEPLKSFGSGALPMGSPQAEAYLNIAVQAKAATVGGEDALLANVKALFTPGRSITIHMMHPQNKRRHDMAFAAEGPLTLSPDGKSTFTVIGSIQHSSLETAPYRADKATKARIVGQLGHREGTLAPNYVLNLDFYDPRENRYSSGNGNENATIFDKKILSENGLYYWNWWTD